ncbi:MAG: ABC transporter permease [Bacteroidetes bacterium]|nr:ABC transporter permease [Bacteroidota bacterium]MCB0843397.1 ABC transporter permease [Bacteroidota bacterium]MCB0852807.1 ABC transporter permease [Bacteroidota bacterium]
MQNTSLSQANPTSEDTSKPRKARGPKWWIDFLVDLAGIYLFVVRFFKDLFRPPYEFKEVLNQCYIIGYKTLPLIAFTAYIGGIVFTRQSRPSLESFGAVSWLPSLVGVGIIRSLGPLIAGLIGAGKIASNIGAELGSMKVTEQIDAMEVSGTNPFTFLVITRVLACSLMLPILVIFTDILALLGGFTNVYFGEGVSFSLYFSQAFSTIEMEDIFASTLKSVLFGFSIGIIGCYKGFTSKKGTVGVGKAANSSVVMSMFMVFVIDLFTLQIMTFIRNILYS